LLSLVTGAECIASASTDTRSTAPFLFGFLVARHERVWIAISRFRRPGQLLAAAMFLSWLVLRQIYAPGQPVPLAVNIYAGVAYGC